MNKTGKMVSSRKRYEFIRGNAYPRFRASPGRCSDQDMHIEIDSSSPIGYLGLDVVSGPTELRRSSCLIFCWINMIGGNCVRKEFDSYWVGCSSVRDVFGVRSQLECVVGTLDDTSTPDLRPSRPIDDSGALRAPATAIAAAQRRCYQM
jgi:hypothetical protein